MSRTADLALGRTAIWTVFKTVILVLGRYHNRQKALLAARTYTYAGNLSIACRSQGCGRDRICSFPPTRLHLWIPLSFVLTSTCNLTGGVYALISAERESESTLERRGAARRGFVTLVLLSKALSPLCTLCVSLGFVHWPGPT